ncbi:hypothetical protein JCM14713_30430 [Desulfomicrobium salsuginis]
MISTSLRCWASTALMPVSKDESHVIFAVMSCSWMGGEYSRRIPNAERCWGKGGNIEKGAKGTLPVAVPGAPDPAQAG